MFTYLVVQFWGQRDKKPSCGSPKKVAWGRFSGRAVPQRCTWVSHEEPTERFAVTCETQDGEVVPTIWPTFWASGTSIPAVPAQSHHRLADGVGGWHKSARVPASPGRVVLVGLGGSQFTIQ